MPQPTTLEDLIKEKFGGTLAVTSIGDLRIVITNDPDYSATKWTVTATGASRDYAYPLFGNDALTLADISISLTYRGPKEAAEGLIRADLDFGGIDFDVEISLSMGTERFNLISQLSAPVSLTKVVGKLSAGKAKVPEAMTGTLIDRIAMSIEKAEKSGWKIASEGRLAGTGFLPFSGKATSLSLTVEYGGKKKVKLTRLGLEGRTSIGKSGTLSLGYTFGPGFQPFPASSRPIPALPSCSRM